MTMKILSTIDDVIDEMGGPTAIAAWLNISQSAVSNWRIRNEIPMGWHYRLARHAERLGMRIDDAVFNLDPNDPKAPQPSHEQTAA